ncbi:type VII secretion protein EccCa [Corynebacterium sp. CCM 9185]|uniref:type VII secretion protein EccCa n=2 Tax=Corynebacterium marambiense TaxID=2765364 RepID=UPI002003C7C0|nr:type VII secretion protein EccCa [Corynebacterium marambiense]
MPSPRNDGIIVPLNTGEREPAPSLPVGELNVDPVPPAARPRPIPLVRLLMPLVMVLVLAAMIGLMMVGGRGLNPGLLIFPLMMLVSMFAMVNPTGADDPDEQRRVYLRHLSAVTERARQNAAEQRMHEFHRHPDPASLHSRAGSPRMWERRATDPDALEIRLGIGPVRLCTPVVVADTGAPEDLDPVCMVALRQMMHTIGVVRGVPFAVHLGAFPVIGIHGPGAEGLVRALVAQLVFHHGPDAVGITSTLPGHGWMKWLPHSRHPGNAAFRVLITGPGHRDGVTVGGEVATVIDIGSVPGTELGEIARAEGLLLHVDGSVSVDSDAGREELGIADTLTAEEMTALARSMTGYRRPRTDAGAEIGADLLALLGFGGVAALTGDALWNRRGTDALAVPIGVDDTGKPVVLDIREPAHGGVGPHGLCIGATGSGKSELLRTLVVALAATHSPAELNLVLVDFKGGATFLGLEGLPHTSAVITNLSDEAHLVERMHDAISGEMNRRQELLRRAGGFANVTDHNAAVADRDDLDPLPALLIVIDEFSELLGQHPDFADLFTAVGRLGRSLQVHLLLASQRLDEGRLRGLESHLSYRIGLKTFSAAESRQVLGVPDAYFLPARPGTGYLRVEAERLTRFRAAYVSAPVPVEAHSGLPAQRMGTVVCHFDAWSDVNGNGIQAPVALSGTRDNGPTLLDVVVTAAVDAAQEQGTSAHRIWLPPLPTSIGLGEIHRIAELPGRHLGPSEPGFLRCAIGIIDRPFQQRQDPYFVEFTGTGSHMAVCGGPQTGKSTTLRSIMLSLAATHDSGDIRFYVLDYGGRSLGDLGALPHVAGCAGRGEPEKTRRIIDEVIGLIDGGEHRHTFLVVDGWQSVIEVSEDLRDCFARIAAEGPGSRVHLVVSTQRWTSIRPAVRDLISHRMELKLTEPLDSLIDRRAQENLPALPGRGITGTGEPMLTANSGAQDLAHVLRLAQESGSVPVPRLRELPRDIPLSALHSGGHVDGAADGIVFGVGGPRLEPLAWDPDTDGHLLCLGSRGSGKSTLVSTIASGITALGPDSARMVVVDPRRTHLGTLDESMLAVYAATSDATVAAVADTVATLNERLPGSDVTASQLRARSWWSGPDIFLIVDDHDLLPDGVLAPLKALVPHSQDIGLHVILVRKSGGASRAMYDPFIAELRDQSPAVLLLDADREEGPLLGIRPVPQPPGRGTWMTHGNIHGICQIAHP